MRYINSIVLVLLTEVVFAQSTNAPLNSDYYHWLDRYEIKSGKISSQLFTTIKPYKREALVRYLDTLNAHGEIFTSHSDQFNLEFLRNDSWEWSRTETNTSKKPFMKHLYKKKSDLAYVDIPEFDIHVNPVLYLGAGKDNNRDEWITINTRGVEVRGMIDRKIGFYTFVGENQAVLPQYVADEVTRNRVVPHEGYWKAFKTTGVDFFEARAYIDFSLTKHIYMQFGNDRTFIGNGYRSLIFSDYSAPNLFLRTNVKVWKLNYLFQLNRMAADARVGGGRRYPEKFMAFHHASVNIGKKLNVGLFESVVFSPKDSVNNNSFDFSYLNPVIFYRAIEQQFGSSDNAILGADIKWNAFKKISFYGQLVLDEFLLKEITAGNGWWANKYAMQGGVKYIDAFGIANLDLQAEINRVRPYTYSHYSQYGSYSNYRQALAHPLGANFNEVLAMVRCQPTPRLNVTLKTFFMKVGRDNTDENWGGNILLGYQVREQEYGNKVGQGVSNTIITVDFNASYMLKHNLFVEARQILRQSKSELAAYNYNTTLSSLALRWNIPQRSYDF
ncbi:MAG: hypothetical protein BroJett042_20730 [Bacteroidota bacterium]|nr:MAG: hypothetical protein BroJett042_20730 [Bacteroidota bacterium]